LAAFIVRKGKPVELVDLGAVQPVGVAIEAWRKWMGNNEEARGAAKVIRERVWEPLEKVFTAGETPVPRTIIVSLDAELATFPLAALPGREPGTYLLEDYTLAVIPAAEALVRRASQAGMANANEEKDPTGKVGPALGNMLVVADVNYDSRSAPVAVKAKRQFAARAARDEQAGLFEPLDGTRGELATIHKMYRDNFGAEGITTLESAAANQETVVSQAQKHLFLHLATHGYFASPRFKSAMARRIGESRAEKPAEARDSSGAASADLKFISNQSLAGYHPGLLSGLALAGANKPNDDDDGILTAEEVGSLNLSRAELVVLSACETGLGQAAGGEGLLGLQRAFQAAGAKTVIASLWNVDDVATRDLMERFYDNLWNKNMGKLEALREAQLWMLKERGPRGLTRIEGDREQGTGSRLPPYYWAAWVLSGDWR
jgi:CHAT domain-containing protein